MQVDTLGLQLAEAKELLRQVQEVVIEEQVRHCLDQQVACPHCRRARPHKDARKILVHTLFGTLRLSSPRWRHCSCQPRGRLTLSPLAEVLPGRVTPEQLYLEAKFAGLVSYGLSAKLLAEVLPLGRSLQATMVRRQVQAMAQRLEDELGREQAMFIQSCEHERAERRGPSCRSPSASTAVTCTLVSAPGERAGLR